MMQIIEHAVSTENSFVFLPAQLLYPHHCSDFFSTLDQPLPHVVLGQSKAFPIIALPSPAPKYSLWATLIMSTRLRQNSFVVWNVLRYYHLVIYNTGNSLKCIFLSLAKNQKLHTLGIFCFHISQEYFNFRAYLQMQLINLVLSLSVLPANL